MNTSYIVAGCWILFLLYWLVSARRVKATLERENRWLSLVHRLPLGCSYFLMANWHLPPPWNLPVTSHTAGTRVIGVLICVYGLFITLWARRTLADNWSGDVTFKQGHELIRIGPYRYVRHPIYAGLLTLCLGTAGEIGQVRGWLALPLMAIAFWIKLKQEERLLLRHFPDTYPAYQKQVKALVPCVI